MPSIYLMRHGQASFASDDYDQLSDLGYQQAKLNGSMLASQGRIPQRVLHGSLKRQQQSVNALLDGIRDSGVRALPEVVEDDAWNEFDHTAVIEAHAREAGDLRALVAQSDDKEAAFATFFVAAMKRWVSDNFNSDYGESFAEFEARVNTALTQLSDNLLGAQRTLVVTSGGPIALVAKQMLNMDTRTALELNWRLVNGGLTKIAVSHTQTLPKLQLVSLNEHMHFSGEYAHLLSAR